MSFWGIARSTRRTSPGRAASAPPPAAANNRGWVNCWYSFTENAKHVGRRAGRSVVVVPGTVPSPSHFVHVLSFRPGPLRPGRYSCVRSGTTSPLQLLCAGLSIHPPPVQPAVFTTAEPGRFPFGVPSSPWTPRCAAPCLPRSAYRRSRVTGTLETVARPARPSEATVFLPLRGSGRMCRPPCFRPHASVAAIIMAFLRDARSDGSRSSGGSIRRLSVASSEAGGGSAAATYTR